MHYINGDGGIKNPKEKFKFVNLLTENAKYEIVITKNAIYDYWGVSGSVVERRTLRERSVYKTYRCRVLLSFCGLTSQSTIFHSCRDGATYS